MVEADDQCKKLDGSTRRLRWFLYSTLPYSHPLNDAVWLWDFSIDETRSPWRMYIYFVVWASWTGPEKAGLLPPPRRPPPPTSFHPCWLPCRRRWPNSLILSIFLLFFCCDSLAYFPSSLTIRLFIWGFYSFYLWLSLSLFLLFSSFFTTRDGYIALPYLFFYDVSC